MNRVIIVTGSRKGLGLQLASHFLENGDFVFGCSRKPSELNHINYSHYCLDVSDEIKVKKMISEIYSKHNKIDILINNAGIASMNHSMLTTYLTTSKIINTNFVGTFLMCREVSKFMIKHKNGRIINFSTVAVPLNLDGELVYSSSKAAVEQLTRVLASELGESHITVNAIGPTPISTDLIKNVPENKIQNLVKRQSVKRLGNITDVINVVEFFISPKSDFITGQIIYLGGIN